MKTIIIAEIMIFDFFNCNHVIFIDDWQYFHL